MQDSASEHETFNDYRPLLFAIAYRMVGSVMDAEDIVQEAYLRWQRRDYTEVQSPKAYLSTVVTRLSIDHLRAAHTTRETYVGPWLPEPLIGEQEPDVAETAALHESLSMAFLVLLENLTPQERAVFLLHDVFGYDFREIGGIVQKSEANCRQLARRARQQIHAGRPRFTSAPDEQERLTQEFIRACAEGDLNGLVALLAEDATLWPDSGGKVPAAIRPVHGAQRVAPVILSGMRQFVTELVAHRATINGQPGVLISQDGTVIGAVILTIADGKIAAIHSVLNPDKLQAVTPYIRTDVEDAGYHITPTKWEPPPKR